MGISEILPLWAGDLRLFLNEPWASVLAVVGSVLAGAIVGLEREKKQKPAGLRTIILISLGSTVFTLCSLLAGNLGGDPARIAAQIISGIGFLGAGAILRERGGVVGLTTAAGIWVVASIGILIGLGYVVAGLILSVMIFLTLTFVGRLEAILQGPCQWENWAVEFRPDGGRTQILIESLLKDYNIRYRLLPWSSSEEPSPVHRETIHFWGCKQHEYHRPPLKQLADMEKIESIRRLSRESDREPQ